MAAPTEFSLAKRFSSEEGIRKRPESSGKITQTLKNRGGRPVRWQQVAEKSMKIKKRAA